MWRFVYKKLPSEIKSSFAVKLSKVSMEQPGTSSNVPSTSVNDKKVHCVVCGAGSRCHNLGAHVSFVI